MANADHGESCVDVTVPMAAANTEYSVVLPGQVKAIEFQAREAVDIRHSFVNGKVAGSTDPFRTLKSGNVYIKELLWISGPVTLYFASASTSKNVEVRYWL